MTLRRRCEVLKAIAGLEDKATLDAICDSLQRSNADMDRNQVMKAVYQLLEQDRIWKGDEGKIPGKSGRPQFYYIVNEEWVSKKQIAKRKPQVGRKVVTGAGGALQTNTRTALAFGIVPYRDRKIKLLCNLVNQRIGTERDLLIGILADYGHKFS